MKNCLAKNSMIMGQLSSDLATVLLLDYWIIGLLESSSLGLWSREAIWRRHEDYESYESSKDAAV